MKAGDIVWDDLTNKEAVVEQVLGRLGVILVDKSWLDGGRHAWEITSMEEHNAPAEIPEYECPACGHKTICWDEYKNHFHFCEEEL